MNKKLLTSLLCSTFLFGLSACSSHDTSSSNTKNEQETSFG
ncbi:YgdI/YgdR family lipoprotein [Bacillus hominis]